MEILFLSKSQILAAHTDLIEKYGGEDGVRDEGLLDSALAAPESGSIEGYFHADLFEMAAAYLFHLVKNHPFIDGNKRIALAAAWLFLWRNGWEIEAEDPELVRLVLDVATSVASKAQVADVLRRMAKPRPD